MTHQCYGRRDMRHDTCPKHGYYTYFNYFNKCPKCLEEEGLCPRCGHVITDFDPPEGNNTGDK